jgi:hypothetical protein
MNGYISRGSDVMRFLTVAGRGSDVMNFLRLRDLEQIHASQKKNIFKLKKKTFRIYELNGLNTKTKTGMRQQHVRT